MTKKVSLGQNNQLSQNPSSEKDAIPVTLQNELFNQLPEELWQQLSAHHQSNKSRQILPGQELNPQKATENFPQLISEQTEFRFQNNLGEISLKLRDQQETNQQIKLIRTEIETIANQINQINQQAEEIKIEADKNIPQESKYQFSFLARLLEFLQDIRQRVEEGNVWLVTFQKKNQKRNYFWNQTKKSGAKFMLASDRTPATQIG
jgi:hypothetical protein